jgi:D-alanyl-lipoteichoic acid acyltransferase DltB (MBOAT superfamily)
MQVIFNYKLIWSTITAFVLFSALLWCSHSTAVSPTEKDFILNLSIIILGITIGWIAGILSSPYGEKEKEQFSTIVKGVTVFFSGYALAKVDPIITVILKPKLFLEPVVAFRAIAFCISLLLALVITFVYRKYAKVTRPKPNSAAA